MLALNLSIFSLWQNFCFFFHFSNQALSHTVFMKFFFIPNQNNKDKKKLQEREYLIEALGRESDIMLKCFFILGE
jgi:hypothetical protein